MEVTARLPDSAPLQACMGFAWQEAQQPAKALTCYERAQRLGHVDAELFKNLGIVLQQLGRIEEALGAYDQAIVLQPDTAGSTATLFVRNAPVDNQLTLETGAWREDARLAPGEERRIQVPLDRSRGATLITFTSASGFRPSAVDPASRDARFLGVWVHVQR